MNYQWQTFEQWRDEMWGKALTPEGSYEMGLREAFEAGRAAEPKAETAPQAEIFATVCAKCGAWEEQPCWADCTCECHKGKEWRPVAATPAKPQTRVACIEGDHEICQQMSGGRNCACECHKALAATSGKPQCTHGPLFLCSLCTDEIPASSTMGKYPEGKPQLGTCYINETTPHEKDVCAVKDSWKPVAGVPEPCP